MKLSFLFILISVLFLGIHAKGQDVYRGIVRDTAGEVIPFATLYVMNADKISKGWVGDRNGYFAIEKNSILRSDSLYVNSLGFVKKAVAIDTLSLEKLNEITLEPKIFDIKEVEISSKTRVKSVTLGTYKKRANWGYWCPGPNGYTLAVYVENKDKIKNGFLQSIKIKFKNLPKKDISDRVRIHVYAVAKDSLNPGEELLPTSVYPTESDVSGKWLKVDLSNYNIKFPENGVFVGCELLPVKDYSNKAGYRSNEKLDLSKSVPDWIIEMEANQICLFRTKNDNDVSNTWFKKDVYAYWKRELKKLRVNLEWASEAVIGAKIIYYGK